MQAYSNPKRETDPHALPDLEVWYGDIWEADCERCGEHEVVEYFGDPEPWCPSCERSSGVTMTKTVRTGFAYWYCFPGCLPESSPIGPFETEAEALADARDGIED